MLVTFKLSIENEERSSLKKPSFMSLFKGTFLPPAIENIAHLGHSFLNLFKNIKEYLLGNVSGKLFVMLEKHYMKQKGNVQISAQLIQSFIH